MADEPQQLPVVSVIICNYNYGQWINGAVKSAAAQDYPNKQIIIADDASSDESFEVVNSICDKGMFLDSEDDEKKVFTNYINNVPLIYIKIKNNGGPSRARNIGIKYAWDTSHLFAILDADDAFIQGKLSKCVAKILESPEVIGAVYTDYVHMTPDNIFSYESKEPYSRERLIQDCIVHSGCVISKLALAKVGLYNEELRTCEDYNLWLKISNYFIITHIPEFLHIVRLGQHQSSHTIDQERWQRDYQLCKVDALGLK
jgi:glycosyltransferase involved in cell wall biosynthesis